MPSIRDASASVRYTIYTEYRDVQQAIRDDRWKLIRYPEINFTQLFDLKNDPHEMKNLAAEPKQAKRVEALTAALVAWQTKLGDAQPLSTDSPKPRQIDLSKPAAK